jgi:hypothetical protein
MTAAETLMVKLYLLARVLLALQLLLWTAGTGRSRAQWFEAYDYRELP